MLAGRGGRCGYLGITQEWMPNGFPECQAAEGVEWLCQGLRLPLLTLPSIVYTVLVRLASR
jgi:hypothetical protein